MFSFKSSQSQIALQCLATKSLCLEMLLLFTEDGSYKVQWFVVYFLPAVTHVTSALITNIDLDYSQNNRGSLLPCIDHVM